MAKANRQKYNFLTALLTQVESAMDEGDELYESFVTLVRMLAHTADIEERLDGVQRWCADLESSLEELDGDGSESSGEELEPSDDGDDDVDVGWDEPEVVRTRKPDGRVPRAVAEPGRRPEPGRAERRAVTEPSQVRERIGRGTRIEE